MASLFLLSTSPAVSVNNVKNDANSFLKNQRILFIENKGQVTDLSGKTVPFVLFSVQAPGVNLYITEKGLTYSLLKNSKENNKPDHFNTEWNRFDMTLKDAEIKKENIITEGKSNHFNQYYLGHCKNGITNVNSYEKIIIKNIYPNIDWVLYNSDDKGFKYDFIVHPGGNPKHIKMAYVSKSPVLINKNGDLEISNSLGKITEKAPVSFLNQKKIDTRFIQTQSKNILLNNDNGYESTISFEFPTKSINHLTSDLIIDPQLVWGTFYGSNANEFSNSIVSDNIGNVIITGNANSMSFPTQNIGGYFQGTFSGGIFDIFILKFAASGALLWSTYYGGSGQDHGNAITVDSNDNIFVTGATSSSDFPILNAGTYFQSLNSTSGGGQDVYILKFDSNGNRLWATYYGGTNTDIAYSIAVDLNNNVFITGFSLSPDFPTLNSGTYFQGLNASYDDVFILKFDNIGNQLWATFYGGTEGERGLSITTDLFGNVFVTGHTNSPDLPILNTGGTAFFQPFSGATSQLDLFIAKFNNNGALLWATFYGGTSYDVGYSVITDQSGNVFIGGETASINFPVFSPGGNTYFQSNNNGLYDVYLLKFDNTGNRLWATYYGGSDNEINHNGTYNFDKMLAIDACGNLFCSFDTKSSDLFTKAYCGGGYLNTSSNGLTDYFITRFTNSGELEWATYLGGDGDDFGPHISVDMSNNLFLSGNCNNLSNGSSYPLIQNSNSYFDGLYNGSLDLYISQLKFTAPNNSLTFINPINCQCNGSATISTNGCPPFNYYWSNGTSVLNTTLTTSSISGLCPGVYQATITSNCSTYITSANLVNTQTLVATINASDSITCISPNVSLTSNSSASTYSWSGPSIISATNTSSALVNAPGIYSLSLTDANGCTATSTVLITQNTTLADIICGSDGTTITCLHPSVFLDSYSDTPLITYTWVPSNANTPSVTVTTGGTYTLYVTNPINGCVSSSTTNIPQNTTAPTVTANNNSTLTCVVTSATLFGTGFGNYSWTGPNIVSGATSSNPIVNASGIYTLTITDPSNGCSSSDTTMLPQNINMPSASANNTTTLTCFINTAVLTGTGNGTYLWDGPGIISGGNTNQPIVNAPGVYTLSVTNSDGCTSTATTQVTQALGSPTLLVSPNTTLLIGEQTTLLAESGGSNFTWLPNESLSCLTCTSVIVSPTITTTYCAQTSIGSCTTQVCVTIIVKELCDNDISYSVPNALSPNGDGLNDELCLRGWENCINTFYIAIYDRWGEKIYESNDRNFCWDGKYKGKTLDPAVFMYYIKAEKSNNSKINKKGDITLIR
ncbi:MAG: SBBP repeat-containing protein [Bacteroidia bacterium]|nr:SBBP repeat-containing protein [Bacteroidia bacterium]